MLLKTAKYYSLEYEPENSLFILISLPNEQANDKSYQDFMFEYLRFALKYKPKRLIIDMQKSTYTVSTKMQEWTAKNISNKTDFIQKIAIIPSPDVFTSISAEQLFDEIQQQSLKNIFAENMEKARKWILA